MSLTFEGYAEINSTSRSKPRDGSKGRGGRDSGTQGRRATRKGNFTDAMAIFGRYARKKD